MPVDFVVFALAGAVIGAGGVALTKRAEQIARLTGLGQLLTGAILIGAITSLSGSILSVTAAWEGNGSLAVSNAVGGIAAQTTFLALADMVYRRANLEHAAASEANLLQAAVLIALLSLPILAISLPGLAFLGIHPVSVLIVLAYIGGLHLTRSSQKAPMWRPRLTSETREEDEDSQDPLPHGASVWVSFVLLAGLVAGAGWVLGQVAPSIAASTGLSQSVVGGLFTAVTTSLPELVVAVTAVRRGALALAVGDILGGNCFDILILPVTDVAYRDGTVFAAVGSDEIAWLGLSALLVAVLIAGMLRRQKHGFANLGFETVLLMSLYVVGVVGIAVA